MLHLACPPRAASESARLARAPQARSSYVEAVGERHDEVTRLLRSGLDSEAERARLLALVYDELRDLARRRMASERDGHTLQATALVHEAWLKLTDAPSAGYQNRRHFYGAAAEAMRRVLVDHARKVKSQKRGGDQVRVTLGPDLSLEVGADELLSIHDALEVLESEDPRAAEITRLRFFSGLEVAEVAEVLEISERTVHREWTFARARLAELLKEA